MNVSHILCIFKRSSNDFGTNRGELAIACCSKDENEILSGNEQNYNSIVALHQYAIIAS